MASVRIGCPECNSEFNVAEADLGREVACPTCQTRLRIDPDVDEEPPAPPPEEVAEEPRRRPGRDKPAAEPKPSISVDDIEDDEEDWKTSLPIRSPMTIIYVLLGVHVFVLIILIAFWMSGGVPTTR